MTEIEINFENCCRFIQEKLPNTTCDFTDINEIKKALKNILDDHILSLTECGIHHDDWPDDMELSCIEAFYAMIR